MNKINHKLCSVSEKIKNSTKKYKLKLNNFRTYHKNKNYFTPIEASIFKQVCKNNFPKAISMINTQLITNNTHSIQLLWGICLTHTQDNESAYNIFNKIFSENSINAPSFLIKNAYLYYASTSIKVYNKKPDNKSYELLPSYYSLVELNKFLDKTLQKYSPQILKKYALLILNSDYQYVLNKEFLDYSHFGIDIEDYSKEAPVPISSLNKTNIITELLAIYFKLGLDDIFFYTAQYLIKKTPSSEIFYLLGELHVQYLFLKKARKFYIKSLKYTTNHEMKKIIKNSIDKLKEITNIIY